MGNGFGLVDYVVIIFPLTYRQYYEEPGKPPGKNQ